MGAPVLHGYSLDQIGEMARAVVLRHRGVWPTGDRWDQVDAAWHGIVLCLCEASERPRPADLLYAGFRAVQDDVQKIRQMHGTRYSGEKFARYWLGQALTVPSPEEAVTDRLGAAQVWDLLPARHRDALTACATASGDRVQGAALLGTGITTYDHRLGAARRAFLGIWHDFEAPSRPYKQARFNAHRGRPPSKPQREDEAA